MMTNIVLEPLDIGSFLMKSMDIEFQGLSGIMWKAKNSHNNVLFQLSQKATMPSYLAQLVGTI